jgi:phosphatidylglycerophosphatase A
MAYYLNSEEVASATFEWLDRRGVRREDIAEIVLWGQRDYYPDLTLEECLNSVDKVLTKREVHNAVLTGIQLDILAEEGRLLRPLQDMIENDESLYGCDEILALSIVNVFGSIGFTNYGYIDKVKPGILKKLNEKGGPSIHTFLDDIVGAIAAAACSRIAHRRHASQELPQTPVPVPVV